MATVNAENRIRICVTNAAANTANGVANAKNVAKKYRPAYIVEVKWNFLQDFAIRAEEQGHTKKHKMTKERVTMTFQDIYGNPIAQRVGDHRELAV